MGLDATVRCRCFEEGKLKPGPVPYDDLYIDGEGYIASRRLDARRAELGRRASPPAMANLRRRSTTGPIIVANTKTVTM